MPNGAQEENNKQEVTEEKKKKSVAEEESFEEQLAELVYQDKKRAASIKYYTFYYEKGKTHYKKVYHDSNNPEKGSTDKDSKMSADMLQAAKEGKLFLVSDKAPFLQKVTVDEKGKLKFEIATKNPVQIPENADKKEIESWKTLQNDFDKLIKGNLAAGKGRVNRWWRERSAGKVVKDITKHIEHAAKREDKRITDEVEKQDAKQKESEKQPKEPEEQKEQKFVKVDENVKQAEKKTEEVSKQEPKAAEEVKQTEEKVSRTEEKVNHAEPVEVEMTEFAPSNEEKSDIERAEDLIKQGDFKEAAGIVTQALQSNADQFMKEKYMTDNALTSGLALKQLMEKFVKNGNVALLSELEKMPEYSENKEVYSAVSNLAEMGQMGKEARERIAGQPEGETVNREDVLDVMAAEFASNMLVQKSLEIDITGQMKEIAGRSSGLEMMTELKDLMRDTKSVESLMEGKSHELNTFFKQGINRRQTFAQVSDELVEKQIHQVEMEERKMEKEKEKQKKDEKDALVMDGKDKKSMGMNRK